MKKNSSSSPLQPPPPSSPNPAIFDSSSPVSPSQIPRNQSFLTLPSTRSGHYPSFSPTLQASRRAAPPAVASASRATSLQRRSPVRSLGELCPIPEHAMRLVAAALRPSSVALTAGRCAAPRAGAC